MKPIRIGTSKARSIALSHQQMFAADSSERPIDATRSIIRRLGYVQIDTISVVERAHHHVLWSRNRRYRHAHLSTLQNERKIFEYWAHAASYLPMEDYRMYLPDMQRIRDCGGLWHKANPQLKRCVLERIRQEGPLRSRDFEHRDDRKRSMWQWRPTKAALETLFREGELMIVGREGFQKVFDLRERVLPDWVDTRFPTAREHADFLINRYLDANGFGTIAEMTYLRKAVRPHVQSRLCELEESEQLTRIEVGEKMYYAKAEMLDALSSIKQSQRVRVLSPFDNLVIQRARVLALFGFAYQLECYLPKHKRRHGYFCLPVLWNNRLVARVDCKADRGRRVLLIHNLCMEPNHRMTKRFLIALRTELTSFMRFNQCDDWRVACPTGAIGSTMLELD